MTWLLISQKMTFSPSHSSRMASLTTAFLALLGSLPVLPIGRMAKRNILVLGDFLLMVSMQERMPNTVSQGASWDSS